MGLTLAPLPTRGDARTSAFGLIFCAGALLCAAGCGTTRWTDTQRTATEQLLLSDAIDRSVAQLDVRVLAGKDIYFDPAFLENVADKQYLTSTLRQHLLAQGCLLREKREEATYVVEARAGAVGTNRDEMLFGVPQVNLPTFAAGPVAMPSSIPEIGLMKNTQQAGIAKVALFAYNRKTGKPVWQSGVQPIRSTARATWVLGAGPFQRGTIHNGTDFAGGQLHVPLVTEEAKVSDEGTDETSADSRSVLDVTAEAVFPEDEVGQDATQPAAFQAAETAQPIPRPPSEAQGGE